MATLQSLSSLDRVRACRRNPLPSWNGVVLQKRDGRGCVAGLQTCGSIWACPMCGTSILTERAAELATGVERAHDRGWSMLLQTQTLRHERADDLTGLWDTLSDAWRAIGESRPLRRLRKRYGERGWVKRVEITLGENGWHVHLHALRFFDATLSAVDVAEMEDLAAAAWQRRARRIAPSFEPDREHGTDWRLLDLQGARAEVAAYLAKSPERAVQADRAARELAGTGKRGRRGSRTPWQLLDDLVAYGEADDLTRWWEYEAATKGRRCVEWSRNGLRDELVPTEERTDEEIAQEGDDQGEDVAVLELATWRAVTAVRGRADHLLGLIGQAGDVTGAQICVHVQLRAWGLDPPDWGPDRPAWLVEMCGAPSKVAA